MIFSDELDKSLLLILKKDKKNRKEIIDFLRGIPKGLIINLQNEIKFIQSGYNEYDVIIHSQLSKEYKSKSGNSYSYKYDSDVNELLILKCGVNKDTTILSLSSYNKYIGKLYNIKIQNNKLKKKEYTYGISETKDKKLFYRIDETKDIIVPLIKEVKENKKVKSLKLNDLKNLK